MAEKQSWENCKYHLGNLERDIESITKTNPQARLMRAIIPETEENKLFKKEGVNQWYYCTYSKLIELGVYRRDGIPNKKKRYIPVAQLFHLNILEDSSLDWFGSDRHHLESTIEHGLRMCAHCKFYKKK
jgi:hypothetical protein